MDTNGHKCNCLNPTTIKESNLKSSKTSQIFSNDSDIFYDVPNENDSAITKSLNRSGTTQNDRNRDYSNLSHEPNIEAPAGPTQQPAGHRQKYQAKDKNDENEDEDGNNIDKERSFLGNYLTRRGSSLCSNVSQEKFRNLSSEAGSSIVKLSFSTNACANLHGSYECFCAEEEVEVGSCHKFWCQRYEVLGNEKKTIEKGSMRAFETEKKSTEKRDVNETRIACCSEKTIFDLKTEPTNECLCEQKRSIVCSCTESCKNDEIEFQRVESSSRTGPNPSEQEENNGLSPRVLNLIEQRGRLEPLEQPRARIFDSSKYKASNATQDLCECQGFKDSTIASTELSKRLYLKDSNVHEGKHLEGPNLDKSFLSVETGLTSRQTIDENVVPLLKSIFDVLQAMRQENLHLAPIVSKNIDINLDEPFNGLTPPPPAPPSSPKFSKQFIAVSADRDFINSEDNLAILEPPERDVEDFEKTYQDTSNRTQRLIPVDMDLLRTDEELIWEPGSSFEKPEKARSESREMFTFERKSSKDLHNIEKAESVTRLSSLKRSFSMEADDFNNKNFSDGQKATPTYLRQLRIDQNQENEQTQLKIQVSQAVQVNSVSLQNLIFHSEQVLTSNSQVEDLSDEKHLKTSEKDKSKDTLLPKESFQRSMTKFDVSTDCIDFDNDVDDRNSTKSCHCSQEPTKQQNHEMSQFIESIHFDLKAMNSFRKNNSHWQSFARLPCASTGGWQKPSKDLSYPVTIETVQELGANSLFVKWRVQNFGNIGGYEIFLDGHLTNRYFSCIHQAAVICDVDLHCHHRITLRAQPLFSLSTSMLLATNSCSSSTSNTKYTSNSTTHPEASCPQPDGSVWYPSVYHFEPNSFISTN